MRGKNAIKPGKKILPKSRNFRNKICFAKIVITIKIIFMYNGVFVNYLDVFHSRPVRDRKVASRVGQKARKINYWLHFSKIIFYKIYPKI